MRDNEKLEFCKDILRMWHMVRKYGLLVGDFMKSPFGELNMVGVFMSWAYGEEYLRFLWMQIEAFWEENHETQENRKWKKELLYQAYQCILMMEPVEQLTKKIAEHLTEEDGALLIEWNDNLRKEIDGMEKYDYDLLCEIVGLPMGKEENPTFEGIAPVEEVITELFESETMREYLIDNKDSLSKDRMVSMICCAAIDMKCKQRLFSKLARIDESYEAYAKCAGTILESISLKENEVFLVEMYWCDEESQRKEHRVLGLAGSYEKALELILGAADDEEEVNEWFLLNKWAKENGGYKDKSFYVYAKGGIMYCAWDENVPEGLSEEHFDCFDPYEELNLPTPFQLDDVIKIDCRPFAPPHNVLILENQWPEDCCSLQGLYVERDGSLSSGAVKHNFVFPGRYYPYGSPLYRAEHVERFAESDEVLMKVRNYIGGDPDKSEYLQKYIAERKLAAMMKRRK